MMITLSAGISSAVTPQRGDADHEVIADSGPRAVIRGSVIELSSDTTTKFEIFSITGQLIRSVNVQPATTVKVELTKGFYILKCDSWTRRVMIK